jgi:Arc/MetJ family transcription regulator
MRTRIDIDGDLIAEAMAVLGLPTKKATVEAALSHVVRQAKRRQAVKDLIDLGWEGDLTQRGRAASSISGNDRH